MALDEAVDGDAPWDAADGEPIGASVPLDRRPIDRYIDRHARCADPRGSYTALFYSDHPLDIARAKGICHRCTVRDLCLLRAIERGEPFGVWGGESVLDGRVVGVRRGRGRPPKAGHPEVVDELTGEPVAS